MIILITGGCGFIGSNFIHYIMQRYSDWRLFNLDKLTYAGSLKYLNHLDKDSRYQFIYGDIADRNLVEELFFKHKFDVVINFAAESHVDRSISNPSLFIESNVKGVQVLLDVVRRYHVCKFIQISTDEVYGSLRGDGKFTEESPLLPNNPYAASKAAADLICRSYYITYGLPIIITRSCNNYGPFQFPEKLIPKMILRAIEGKPLTIYGNGENIRDWLYVEDKCKALELIIKKGKSGEVYNLGGGNEKRVTDVVRLICRYINEETGKPIDELLNNITFIEDPRGRAHDFRYSLDWNKIKIELGWEPGVSFEKGLRQTIIWYIGQISLIKEIVNEKRLYLNNCEYIDIL